MENIIRKDGNVYLVSGDKKGFETYYYLGKDPSLFEVNEKEKQTIEGKPKDIKPVQKSKDAKKEEE